MYRNCHKKTDDSVEDKDGNDDDYDSENYAR